MTRRRHMRRFRYRTFPRFWIRGIVREGHYAVDADPVAMKRHTKGKKVFVVTHDNCKPLRGEAYEYKVFSEVSHWPDDIEEFKREFPSDEMEAFDRSAQAGGA
jgi:hypothetical protein